jgi:hypothetical protein
MRLCTVLDFPVEAGMVSRPTAPPWRPLHLLR